MDLNWEDHGIETGRISEADIANQRGCWTIGNSLPSSRPGYCQRFFYKSWVATPAGYGWGICPGKNRADDDGENKWEYVNCFVGRLRVMLHMSDQLVDYQTIGDCRHIVIPPANHQNLVYS
jgi:hypothetical protein